MASIPIDIPYFKEKLLRDRRFLRELYESSSLGRKRILAGARDIHLQTLIEILHLIYQHVIPLSQEQGQALVRSRKSPLMKKYFRKNSTFLKLHNSSRVEQLQVLSQFVSVYEFLLAPLFEP